MLRRVLVGLLAVVSALGLAVAGRIAWVGYGPPPGAPVTTAQVAFLQRSIAAGDGARMQRLFPEGDFFLRTLTAMAAAHTPSADWPCDTVVAVSALADAAVLLEQPEWLATVRTWHAGAVVRSADPATGLLPHRVDGEGRSLEGPRGSSQSVIQAFWPTIGLAVDGRPDIGSWPAFRRWFVVREAGLAGVREYPQGTDGGGDVDSGPLLLGVSASASTVTPRRSPGSRRC